MAEPDRETVETLCCEAHLVVDPGRSLRAPVACSRTSDEHWRLYAAVRHWPKPSELGLVLVGGTAIALRIGHRFSLDFDFFTDKSLDKDALRDSFPFVKQSTVIQDSLDTFTVLVPFGFTGYEHVNVSFFGSIGCCRVGKPGQTADGLLQVASIDDLAERGHDVLGV